MTHSSPDSGLDQCPVCKSRLVSLFERQECLFVVSCENDDCIFTVETVGGSAKEAVQRWNTRPAQAAPEQAPALASTWNCPECGSLIWRYPDGRQTCSRCEWEEKGTPPQCTCGRPLECPECMSLRTEPQASQIVAWRWRRKGNADWWTGETVPTVIAGSQNWEIEPLGVIQPQAALEALELAEDVLSRAPFSTGIWPNGMHPQVGIDKIRDAIKLLSRTEPQAVWQPIGTAPRGKTICVAREGSQRDDGSTYWYQATGHLGLTDGHFHRGYGELYGEPELWAPYPENPEHCSLSRPQQD